MCCGRRPTLVKSEGFFLKTIWMVWIKWILHRIDVILPTFENLRTSACDGGEREKKEKSHSILYRFVFLTSINFKFVLKFPMQTSCQTSSSGQHLTNEVFIFAAQIITLIQSIFADMTVMRCSQSLDDFLSLSHFKPHFWRSNLFIYLFLEFTERILLKIALLLKN